MAAELNRPPRVLFLISDTGGGHRAAANAIAFALSELAPGCEIEVKDALRLAGCFPVNRSPEIYAWGMAHGRWIWAIAFHLMNGPRRARLMAVLGYPGMAKRLRALLREGDPDVVVSTHPLLTNNVRRALAENGDGTSFMIVVTDLVTGHACWHEPGADRLCLPTEEALDRAAAHGVPRSKMTVTGQPIHPRATRVLGERDALRTRLGWKEPIVLMMGGGVGVGDLGSRVRAVAEARLSVRLVVICGRNEKLRAELAAETWPIPVDVRGFVDNVPELMAAADILVTKGGPGSVIEGCAAGLPILVYDYLPGQEVGNVNLIREHGAGAYVATASELVAAVRRYVDDPAARRDAGQHARALAVPDSAARIAREVLAISARA